MLEPASTADDDLLQAAVLGDGDALEELLSRHGPVVRSRLEGAIDTRWQAVLTEDDVLQETYIDAFLAIRDYQPRGRAAFISWLSTIARRNLVDAVRELSTAKNGGGRVPIRGQHHTETSYTDLFARLGGTVTSPSQRVARQEIQAVIDAALRELPPQHGEVLMRFDLGGESAEEVAAACGCRVGAMHMRRIRAMKLLQSALCSRSYLLD